MWPTRLCFFPYWTPHLRDLPCTCQCRRHLEPHVLCHPGLPPFSLMRPSRPLSLSFFSRRRQEATERGPPRRPPSPHPADHVRACHHLPLLTSTSFCHSRTPEAACHHWIAPNRPERHRSSLLLVIAASAVTLSVTVSLITFIKVLMRDPIH
jgi:hypothetical protein